MSLVLDNSATMAWAFPDESTPQIEMVFSRIERKGAWVPSLWLFEVANAFQTAVLRGRYTAAFRDGTLADLEVLPIEIETTKLATVWKSTIRLAQRHALTVYDAAYLELACRKELPLASLDDALRKAAEREGLAVLGL